MRGQFATALSHLLLAGTGAYCLKLIWNVDLPLSHCCFSLIILNNVLGLWQNGNPQYGDKVYRLFRITRELQDLFVLPLIATTVWLMYNYRWELALAHLLLPMWPLCMFLFRKKQYKLSNMVVAINVMSLAILSYMYNNYYGFATAFTYCFDYFFTKGDNENFLNIPSQDLSNYIMCFLTFFSVQTLFD